MQTLVSVFSLAICTVVLCPALVSQETQAPAPSKDPKELMLAAARQTNLDSADMKPWHIRATYQSLDESGSVTDEGTFEEWWASSHKSKRVLTGKTSTEAEYTTDKGDFRDSPPTIALSRLTSIQNDLVSPMPNEATIEHSTYSSKAIETGTLKLNCLSAAGVPGASTFCIGTSEPILRIYALPLTSMQVLYNRILRFQGKTVAGDLKHTRNGKVLFTLHIDTIEPLDGTNEAVFAPPQDAKLTPIPHMVNISAAVAAGLLEYKVAPEYPYAAKEARMSGTVVLQGLIGKDGHIKDLKVVSGPDVLQMAALDAVRQWKYRPYLLNGEPVEVMTTINVIFVLGR